MRGSRAMTTLAMASLLSGAAIAAPVVEEGNAPYYTSFEEAKAAAAEKNLPILVKFYTDW